MLAVLVLALTDIGARAAENGPEISNARFRIVISSRPAAGYFTFVNATGGKERLVSASSPDCGRLTLHQSQEVNGVEHMHPVAEIVVPPDGTVKFAPGGYHLMCMSPTAAMKPGALAPVTLKFADGSTVTAGFKVQGAATP